MKQLHKFKTNILVMFIWGLVVSMALTPAVATVFVAFHIALLLPKVEGYGGACSAAGTADDG